MIEREIYMQKIRPFINKDILKIFTGIRRCGKSTLLKLIRKELENTGISEKQIYSINFESLAESNRNYTEVYNEILNFGKNYNGKKYIFLDEIQELSGWEKMVNSIRVDLDCDIYITGLNSRLLSGELATYLAGRYIEISVFPFSFSEILTFEKKNQKNRTNEEIFKQYMLYGGMPFIYENNLDISSTKNYLSDIYNSIVLKDIISRHSIRDVELFERIIAFLFANIGNPFSGNSIVKYLKNEKRNLSLETLYNYISYSQDAFLLHLVPREDIQGKRVLKFHEKIYLTDHGLREVMYGNTMRDINQVLENIIYIELIRRGYKVKVGKINNREVDFIAQRSSERIYIQVAYLLADESTVNREFLVFSDIKDNYSKMVLSLDNFDFSREGIIHRNIIDFLQAGTPTD